ncbi:MAG: sigma-70 family RNA polymerase sigma factor [Bacteroidota bacterium]|jgi:RNA polymerase sigma-70 factor (ECF subfamily)
MDESIHQHRPLLISLAYNILGDIQEAEDIVQDAFEGWYEKRRDVQHPKAYLSRIVVNKSIDRLEAAKKERELYKGPWLPVPVVSETPSQEKHPQDLLPIAVLALLEKLNPIERAVFILREAFDYPYREIADLCNLPEDHARQILHRAREKVQRPRSRFQADYNQQQRLMEAFLKACERSDEEELKKILAEDVSFFSDGGGKVAASRVPLFGHAAVLKFWMPVVARIKHNIEVRFVEVNGCPGAMFLDKETGKIDTIFTVDVEGDKIAGLYIVRNPEKILLKTVTKS